jgi:hypothetical protein
MSFLNRLHSFGQNGWFLNQLQESRDVDGCGEQTLEYRRYVAGQPVLIDPTELALDILETELQAAIENSTGEKQAMVRRIGEVLVRLGLPADELVAFGS